MIATLDDLFPAIGISDFRSYRGSPQAQEAMLALVAGNQVAPELLTDALRRKTVCEHLEEGFADLRDMIHEAGHDIHEAVSAAASSVKEAIFATIRWIGDHLDRIASFLTSIWDRIRGILGWLNLGLQLLGYAGIAL